MKLSKIFLLSLCALGIVSCSDSNNEPEEISAKELSLKSATVAYVDNTVLPTYKAMVKGGGY